MNVPDCVARSSRGATITPPRTRQLSTTPRERARYQASSTVRRANCWSLDEPIHFELTVAWTDASEPRVGLIGLFTRGRVMVPVKVASTRFCWSALRTSGVQALKNAQKFAAVASV